MNSDERIVFERLEAWRDVMGALMRDLDRLGFRGAHLPQARGRYRDIKDQLRTEYKANATKRGTAALNSAERRWYQPTIHRAAVHLRAKVDGSGEAIFRSLSEARMDISMTIHRMMAGDDKARKKG